MYVKNDLPPPCTAHFHRVNGQGMVSGFPTLHRWISEDPNFQTGNSVLIGNAIGNFGGRRTGPRLARATSNSTCRRNSKKERVPRLRLPPCCSVPRACARASIPPGCARANTTIEAVTPAPAQFPFLYYNLLL